MHVQTNRAKLNRGIAIGVGGISLLMQLASLFLAIIYRNQIVSELQAETVPGNTEIILIFSVTAAVSIPLSLLINYRNPSHTIGWLFLAIGFFFSWVVLSNVADFSLGGRSFSGIIHFFLVTGSLWYLLPLMISLGLIPLLFPDGRLPSPRWRPVLYVLLTGIILQTITQIVLDLQGQISVVIPEGMLPVIVLVQEISAPIVVLGILGGIVSLVVRFSHSRGFERQQMKWPVYTATLSISLMLLILIIFGEDSDLLSLTSALIPIFLAVGVGFAILRFRLYDIDIIIRRTLQYALLTAVLAGVYFGGVVLLQGLFGNLSGDPDSPLIRVVSTLAIAALFNPLRIRIQDLIDRRFYRSKYDAEKALEGFAQTTRDEVDLGTLSTSLLQVVGETMQPETVQLALRPQQSDSQRRTST